MTNKPAEILTGSALLILAFLAGAQSSSAEDKPKALHLDRYVLEKKVLIRDGSGNPVTNCSGLTVRSSPPGIFIVCDHPARILELSPDGEFRRSITLEGFRDTEGIAHIRGPEFLVLQESPAFLTRVKIHPETRSVSRGTCPSYELDPSLGNRNPEGLAYDAAAGRFFAVKEKDPRKLYEVELPRRRDGKIRVRHPWNIEEKNLGLLDLAGVFFDVPTGHLVLLSQESNCAVECTTKGREISRLSFGDTFRKVEGIGFSEDRRRLYLCGEPDEFCVYTIQDAARSQRNAAR